MQIQSNSIIPSTIVNKMSYDVKISTSKMTANVRSATIKAHQYFRINCFIVRFQIVCVKIYKQKELSKVRNFSTLVIERFAEFFS